MKGVRKMDRVAEAKARIAIKKRQRKAEKKKQRREKIKGFFKKISTLNIILVVVFAIFLWFNKQMIDIYRMTGNIPETYACAVVAALLGECGFCGWIKTSKHRLQDRKWTLEDRERRRHDTDVDVIDYLDLDSSESIRKEEENDNGVVG